MTGKYRDSHKSSNVLDFCILLPKPGKSLKIVQVLETYLYVESSKEFTSAVAEKTNADCQVYLCSDFGLTSLGV